MIPFYVLNFDINAHKVEKYDVIPYLVDKYVELRNILKRRKKYFKKLPKTFEEFKQFVEDEGKYQWWSRCQYEIIISDWPCQKYEEKWDVWDQIEMNLDLVTKCFIESIPKPRTRKKKEQ